MALQRVLPRRVLSSLLLHSPPITPPSAVATCVYHSHRPLGRIRADGRRWVSSFNSSHRGTFTSPRNRYRQPTFLASGSKEAQEALVHLREIYGDPGLEHADVIVALGGDGFMLSVLHKFMEQGLPVFGMNRGTVGFLMNDYQPEELMSRLQESTISCIHPLRMEAVDVHGHRVTALAINEVSVFRQTRQAAHVRVMVDGRVRIDQLMCDGVLVATPAGSTAYNLSAHGPVLPLDAGLLALTPISAFRPRRWRGALLSRTAAVRFECIDPLKRPMSATADSCEVRDIIAVDVIEDRSRALYVLCDPDVSLEERILDEQFFPAG